MRLIQSLYLRCRLCVDYLFVMITNHIYVFTVEIRKNKTFTFYRTIFFTK